jgi:hypothetical protein
MPGTGSGRPLTPPTTLFFGFLLVIGGVLALFNPDPTPGDIGDFQYVIFVVMIAGGALILSLAALSFVRYFRDVRSIRERGDGPWLPAEDDRTKRG